MRHSNVIRRNSRPASIVFPKTSFLKVLIQSFITAIILWLTGCGVVKILFYGTAENHSHPFKLFFYCSIIVYPMVVLAEVFSHMKEYESYKDFEKSSRNINMRFIFLGTPLAFASALLIRMLSNH